MTTLATLCYIVKGGKILLIKKKRGLGAGIWNGPGGKVEENEDVTDSVKREVFEEINVVPESPKKMGVLEFYFGQESEINWLVHVFAADDYDGIEKETGEAVPKWFSLNRIPYDDMWPDDVHWLPMLLEKKKFAGKFYFDKDAKILLKHNLEVIQ